MAGGRWPVVGGRWSVVWPAASGRWPVAGGRWSVAGGCGLVVVGPVAGGRWSVAGGCGPVVVGPVAGGSGRWSGQGCVAGGRWPVAGGRWSGRLPQRLTFKSFSNAKRGSCSAHLGQNGVLLRHNVNEMRNFFGLI